MMPDILIGATIAANDFPQTKGASDSTTQSGISSTTYVAGSPTVETTFVAPTSGRVLLSVGAGMRDDTSTNRVHVAPQIRQDTSGGTIVFSADVSLRGVGSSGASAGYEYHSRTTLLTGLEPGRTYHAQVLHKVSGGTTADIAVREIVLFPTS